MMRLAAIVLASAFILILTTACSSNKSPNPPTVGGGSSPSANSPQTFAPAAGVTSTSARSALATATRLPTAGGSPTASTSADAAALLGKQFTSPEVSGFLRVNNCAVSGSRYLCYDAGVELSFDGSNKLVLVVLNRTRGDWKQYRGPLPSGLSWNDTKAAAEQKLGTPSAAYAGLNGIRAWAQYKGGAVIVTYDVANGQAGPGATIYDIRLK